MSIIEEDPQFTILKLRAQVKTMTDSRDRAYREYQHRKPMDGPHWLIEVGSPASYYCGPGDWCSNPNHALQFHCREDAAAVACRFGNLVGGTPRAVEHMWVGDSVADGEVDG